MYLHLKALIKIKTEKNDLKNGREKNSFELGDISKSIKPLKIDCKLEPYKMSESNTSAASTTKLNRSGVRYIFKTIAYTVLHAVIFFVVAGTLDVPRGWLYYGIYLGTTIINLIIIYKFNMELMNIRGKMQEGTKTWDKMILITWIGLLIIFDVIAGLDVGRFGWTFLNFNFAIVGIGVWIGANIIMNWAEITNKYFEGTVRIQADREHQVITTGPYKYVRHPGYIGVILAFIAMPLILGSILTFIPVGAICVLFIIRTYLEDKTLREELEGYTEYAQKTRYRLIPGIW